VVNQSGGRFDPPIQVELWELEPGRRYQAHARLRPQEKRYRSEWSDWSPVVTWELPSTTEELPGEPVEPGAQVKQPIVFPAVVESN